LHLKSAQNPTRQSFTTQSTSVKHSTSPNDADGDGVRVGVGVCVEVEVSVTDGVTVPVAPAEREGVPVGVTDAVLDVGEFVGYKIGLPLVLLLGDGFEEADAPGVTVPDSVPVTEGVGVRVREPVPVAVCVGEGLGVTEEVSLVVRVADDVVDWDVVAVSDGVPEAVAAAVRVALRNFDGVRDSEGASREAVSVSLALCVGEELCVEVAVGLLVEDGDGVTELVGVLEASAVSVLLAVARAEVVREGDGVPLCVDGLELVGDVVEVSEMVDVMVFEGDIVGDDVVVTYPEGEGVPVVVSEPEAVGVVVSDGDEVPDTEADLDALGVAVGELVAVTDGVPLVVVLVDFVGEMEAVVEVVAVLVDVGGGVGLLDGVPELDGELDGVTEPDGEEVAV